MIKKPAGNRERLLTKVELELMRIIWVLQKCTIRDVVSALPQERQLAYTTVATVIKVLEAKKFLSSRKEDSTHYYQPRISKSEYESSFLRNVVDHLFEGEPSSLVMKLINESRISKDELEEIRRTLNERLES